MVGLLCEMELKSAQIIEVMQLLSQKIEEIELEKTRALQTF